MLIAPSPCGTPRRDWPHSNDPSPRAAMALRLSHDRRGTMKYFPSLEVRGEVNPLVTRRKLTPRIEALGAPFLSPRAAVQALIRGVVVAP